MARARHRDEPIQALLKEGRKFPPPRDFARRARVNSPAIYKSADANPVRFWEQQARELRWMKPWRKALDWKPPYAKWFVGGKLNVADNCLDRHVEGPRRTKAALIWEGEPGDSRVLTYWDLYREVNQFAAALKRHGIKKGDPVTIYMPMVPEAAVAMLACARLGAPHSVVFGGFAPDSLRDRINDCRAKLVITADGGYRRGSTVPLKKNTDEALKECPSVQSVVVYRRTGQEVAWQAERDIWWHDFVKGADAYV
ncbi:MAG TPA: AMP-binding protein, partial [Calidithermus sp.]|nr:AMP-binding protein [Calidithermus sp.]